MSVTKEEIKALFANNNNGFATVEYFTKVKTAAAHKHLPLFKHSVIQVQLFSTHSAYETAVKNSAEKLSGEKPEFKKSSAHFEHDPECYSIVTGANGNEMLYCRVIRPLKSEFFLGKDLISMENAALYMTPSEAKKMLTAGEPTHNKTNDVTHNVVIRTISISNLKRVAGKGEVLGEHMPFEGEVA